jgi:hypothetical protein
MEVMWHHSDMATTEIWALDTCPKVCALNQHKTFPVYASAAIPCTGITVAGDSEEAKVVEDSNKRYSQLLATKAAADKYTDQETQVGEDICSAEQSSCCEARSGPGLGLSSADVHICSCQLADIDEFSVILIDTYPGTTDLSNFAVCAQSLACRLSILSRRQERSRVQC